MNVPPFQIRKPDSGPFSKQFFIGTGFIIGLLLLVPLIAMHFTDEVRWDILDFLVAAFLLFGTAILIRLITRISQNTTIRIAFGIMIATSLLLIWVNMAVGIIGSEGNPANLMYGAVIAVGILGSFLVHFHPRGMVKVLLAMALTQALIAVGVLFSTSSTTSSFPGRDILYATSFFTSLWLISAFLFWKAANESLNQPGKSD